VPGDFCPSHLVLKNQNYSYKFVTVNMVHNECLKCLLSSLYPYRCMIPMWVGTHSPDVFCWVCTRLNLVSNISERKIAHKTLDDVYLLIERIFGLR
jgi:hypothetical protein